MHVPLTTQDFLARGATVYPDRIAVFDEPEGGGQRRRADLRPGCRPARERSLWGWTRSV